MRIHYSIMSNAALQAEYQAPWIAWGYDVLARLVFAPVGGLSRLRRDALGELGISSGMRVLELGCGSGGVTQRLVELGAEVTSIDWSVPMLAKAARRAPAARFERAEITSYAVQPGMFDLALFSFVLHELDDAARAQALTVAVRGLTDRGRIAIVDHALPERGLVARAMSRFVQGFEPTSSRQWTREGAAERALSAVEFRPEVRRSLASGMAFVVVGTRVAP